jgi:hypothetical protein
MFTFVLSCLVSALFSDQSKFGRESVVRALQEPNSSMEMEVKQLDNKLNKLSEQLNKKLDGIIGVISISAQKKSKTHSTEMQGAFDRIYKTHEWGYPDDDAAPQKIFSGDGSAAKRCTEYIKMAQSLIDAPDVKTVVEVGCGDLRIQSKLNLNSIDRYICLDVATAVRDNAHQLRGKEYDSKVAFLTADASMREQVVPGDLLLIKVRNSPTTTTNECFLRISSMLTVNTGCVTTLAQLRH